MALGDLGAARARFQEGLEIAKKLAAADPSSASLQRDVVGSLWRLTSFPESGVTWAQVVTKLEDMQARGVLFPSDAKYLEQARRNAQQAASR